jgi:hypothetical protein
MSDLNIYLWGLRGKKEWKEQGSERKTETLIRNKHGLID